MKCSHCGTELDRLSKWLGTAEYCSEECTKAGQEDFDRLAMRRLMQLRPVRTNVRPAEDSERPYDSGTGRLTVVTHPPGASIPTRSEPPEASYIMEASATLFKLHVRHPPAVTPRPMPPLIPASEFTSTDSLRALKAMLGETRPPKRGARLLNPVAGDGFAFPDRVLPELSLPDCDPVWPTALGR